MAEKDIRSYFGKQVAPKPHRACFGRFELGKGSWLFQDEFKEKHGRQRWFLWASTGAPSYA